MEIIKSSTFLILFAWHWNVGLLLAQSEFFEQAHERIEQHRKVDIALKIVDIGGAAIGNATVNIEMTSHDFRWGTAVVAHRINSNASNDLIYKEKLLDNFNSIVFENDLKWPAWEGIWGPNLGWHEAEPALDWLESHNFQIRGHYLSWATLSGVDGFGPNNQVVEDIPGILFPHISDKLQTVGDRVTEWDVINHPIGWGPTTYEDVFGTSFFASIVEHARQHGPAGIKLWMNEDNILNAGSIADQYEQILNYLIDQGASVDGIGFQGHFKSSWGRNLPDTPQRMYAQMERFSSIIPHLQLTEFDIDVGEFDSSGSLLNYDQQLHAQLMTNYLVSAFSHEKLEGITMWGFWEGSHWLPTAALYNQDWSERPALQAYRQLVFDEWWTSESGPTDELGRFENRGFKGTYEVTIELIDGSSFEFENVEFNQDSEMQLSIPILCGDVNGDGSLNLLDVGPFVELLSNGGYALEADVNFDGMVNLLDVSGFVSKLAG